MKKDKKMTFEKQSDICMICNTAVMLILTISVSAVIYLLCNDIGLTIFMFPVLLFIFAFLEERFISILVNTIVEKIVK